MSNDNTDFAKWIVTFVLGTICLSFFAWTALVFLTCESSINFSHEVMSLNSLLDSLSRIEKSPYHNSIKKERWVAKYYSIIEPMLARQIKSSYKLEHVFSYYDNFNSNTLPRYDSTYSLNARKKELNSTIQEVNRIDSIFADDYNNLRLDGLRFILRTRSDTATLVLNLYNTSNPATAKIDVFFDRQNVHTFVLKCHVITDTLIAYSDSFFFDQFPLLSHHWNKIATMLPQDAIRWGNELPITTLRSLNGIGGRQLAIVTAICCLGILLLILVVISVFTKLLKAHPNTDSAWFLFLTHPVIRLAIAVVLLLGPITSFFLPLVRILEVSLLWGIVISFFPYVIVYIVYKTGKPYFLFKERINLSIRA